MIKSKLFYHGSPIKGIKVLKPKFDPRLNIKGIFIADEPFGPMIFSLLPVRAKSIVNYETKSKKWSSVCCYSLSFNWAFNEYLYGLCEKIIWIKNFC